MEIPWIWVLNDSGRAIIDHTRTVLLHQSKHGGAAWAAIEPEKDGIRSWLVLRLGQHIVELLGVTNVQIPRVGFKIGEWATATW